MNYIISIFLLCLMACGDYSLAEAKQGESNSSLNCIQCHNYPPTSGRHSLHLFEEKSPTHLNGRITCTDCHFTSIHKDTLSFEGHTRYTPNLIHQTEILSTNGKQTFTLLNPTEYQSIQNFLTQISRDHQQPLFAVEGTHNDGILNVSFAPNNISTQSKNQYKNLNCSAIECHRDPEEAYKW